MTTCSADSPSLRTAIFECERDEAMCAPASVKFSPSARAVQSHRTSLLRIDEGDHGDNNR